MFPYFGCKSRLAHLYPPPAQGRLIEPFAGSARYSLLYWDRDVWINDIDPLICRIWRYLQQATKKDIESLPELRAGEDLRDFKLLSDVERELLGFAVNFGRPTPCFVCSPECASNNRCRHLKQRILRHLPHIRHWKITGLHYADLPNVEATWFADPPYQHTRVRYRYDCVMDYERLARWCRSRKGQIIVCEREGANWLPFRPLVKSWGQRGFSQEMVWMK